MDGELIDGVGLGEESSMQRLASIPEGANDLGYELSTPMSLLSTIPESDEVLGCTILSPVKRSKCLSDSSEYAGEEGIDSHTSGKQSKQMKVFQRRESPSSKTTKSWVAERVSWNGGRGVTRQQKFYRVRIIIPVWILRSRQYM
jgi:hypothetical protein